MIYESVHVQERTQNPPPKTLRCVYNSRDTQFTVCHHRLAALSLKMHSVNIRAAREHVYWRQSESGLKGLHQDSGRLRHLNHNGAFKLSYSGAGENTTPALTRGHVALYRVTVGARGPSVALTRSSEREIEHLCSERRLFFVTLKRMVQ